MTEGRRVEINNTNDLNEELNMLIEACYSKSHKLDQQGDNSGAMAWSIVARSLNDVKESAQRRRDRLDGN